MTRTGKIARLPFAIREQVNQRLLDGQPFDTILQWLNPLPDVKAVLKAQFDSKPISSGSLTEWKNGGYRDWLDRQQALEMAHGLEDTQAPGNETIAGSFAGKLAHWATLRYAAAARTLAADESNPEAQWRRLRQLCADAARLQHEEHRSQQIALQRDRLELDVTKAEWQWKKDLHTEELRLQFLKNINPVSQGNSVPSAQQNPPPPASTPAPHPKNPQSH